MNDEGGVGNHIEGVIVRGNRMAANNHLGMVVIGIVSDVTVTGNTFDENGRQGINIADDPNVADILISGNTIVQSENANCHLDCSW